MIMGQNWRYLPVSAHDHENGAVSEPEGVAAGAGVTTTLRLEAEGD
jgi:hypothetical protein